MVRRPNVHHRRAGHRLRHGGQCSVWGCVLDNADTITKRLDQIGQAFKSVL